MENKQSNIINYNEVNWVDTVLDNVPELSDIVHNHLNYYNGILSYVLFWEIASFFVDNLVLNKGILSKILNFVNYLYIHWDTKVRELVLYWFLENIGSSIKDIKITIPSELLSWLKEIDEFWEIKE